MILIDFVGWEGEKVNLLCEIIIKDKCNYVYKDVQMFLIYNLSFKM